MFALLIIKTRRNFMQLEGRGAWRVGVVHSAVSASCLGWCGQGGAPYARASPQYNHSFLPCLKDVAVPEVLAGSSWLTHSAQTKCWPKVLKKYCVVPLMQILRAEQPIVKCVCVCVSPLLTHCLSFQCLSWRFGDWLQCESKWWLNLLLVATLEMDTLMLRNSDSDRNDMEWVMKLSISVT